MEIDKFISDIEKEISFGGIIKPLSDVKKPDVIPFGVPSFDKITGVGGVPMGMVTELYGNESSGKSSLCLNLVKNAQDMGIKCCYIDAEMAMTADVAERFGVNSNELLLARPSKGEEALELVKAVSQRGYRLVIVDSVSSLVPGSEYDANIDQQSIGLQARMMSKGMRVIVGRIMHDNTAVVFINQVRDDINKMGFGEKTTTSGGRALKFYAALRMHLSRKAWISKGDDKVGMVVLATTKKNKLSAPMRTAEVGFMFDTGWDILGDLLNNKIANGEIEVIGRTYYAKGEKIGNREEVLEYLRVDA